MRVLLCIALIGLVQATKHIDPWSILPPRHDWRAILRSFEKPDDVDAYVTAYITPFEELQAATRNASVSPDTIKTSMLAMLELVQTACNSFNISEATFDRRQRDDFRAALRNATNCFNGPNAQQIEPVFEPRSLRHFVFQRLDDILVSSHNYSGMKRRLLDYKRHAHSLRKQLHGWSSKYFKFIIHRNIDLQLVKQYSSEIMRANVNKKLRHEDVNKLHWKLHSLGNDAPANKIGSTMLVGSALFALIAFL
jgi:hypothetical protein